MKKLYVVFGSILLLLLSCDVSSPSEEEINDTFEKEVAASNSCATDEQCVIVHPGCPLGCNAAVNIEHQERVKNLAEILIKDYSSTGKSCAYSCIRSFPVCIIDKCEARE